MTANNVQTLNGNAKKRGRPESAIVTAMRALYPDLTSRTSIYNKRRMAPVVADALDLGFVDTWIRDVESGKRMQTKLVEIARLFDDEFWRTDKSKKWLRMNWDSIVRMSHDQLRATVRELNDRHRASDDAG